MNPFKILLICAFFAGVLSIKGVDLSQLYSASVYECFKKQGIEFVSIRGYRSSGSVDPNGATGLQHAHSAGINKIDLYMFPCRGKSASAQVSELFSSIPNNLFTRVWLDIETNPSSGCSWTGHDAASNCAFIQELVNAVKAKGKNPGIYASLYMWESILGSKGACTKVGSQPLWYAHYDGNPSFSDFTPFGGWTKPTAKQYKGDTTLCGASVDLNYEA